MDQAGLPDQSGNRAAHDMTVILEKAISDLVGSYHERQSLENAGPEHQMKGDSSANIPQLREEQKPG